MAVADYGAYDHVVLMQLWGPMVEKPAVLPYFTCDYQQARRGTSLEREEPVRQGSEHNALNDARHLHRCLSVLLAA